MGKKDRVIVEKKHSLPQVRDVPWITPANFADKKLDLGDEVESGGVTRVQIVYKYDNSGKRPLTLTTVREDSAYLKTNGVEEDSYVVPKTGVKTMLGRNVIKLYMDKDNQYHEELYDTLIKIRTAIKKKLDKDTGRKNNVQIKGLYDLVDDDRNVTGHALVARLIESRDGDVYSAAYNDDEQIDIMSVGRSVTRPALTFSYIIPEDEGEYRISVSVTQMYVKSSSMFPLRDRD